MCTRSRRSTPPGCGTARPRTAPAPARTPATSNRMRPMGRGWAAEVIAEQRQRLTWDMWSAERVTGAPARMRARGSHVDGCPVRRDNRCSVELGEDTWPPVVCRHGGSPGVDGEPRGTHSAPVPRRPTRPGRPGSPRPRGEPVAGTRGAGWGRRSVLDRCTRATRGAASTVRRQPDVPAAGRVAVPDPVDRSLYRCDRPAGSPSVIEYSDGLHWRCAGPARGTVSKACQRTCRAGRALPTTLPMPSSRRTVICRPAAG